MQHECVMRSDFEELKRRVDRHGEEIYGPPGEINKGMKAIIVSLNGAVVGLKSTITMWGVIVTLAIAAIFLIKSELEPLGNGARRPEQSPIESQRTSGTVRRNSMAQDLRDTLQLLRFELSYLEQGGYNRDRAVSGTKSPFRSAFACLNFGDPIQSHACRECLLFQFVPEDKKNEDFPCHHILLSESGETVAQLLARNDPDGMAKALEYWLRVTIAKLEATLQRSEQP